MKKNLNMLKQLLLIIGFGLTAQLNAQNTVGLISSSDESDPGYTLLSPIPSNEIFLIDNCGEQVHSWQASGNPALSCYLLPDGSLLRPTGDPDAFFHAGGAGGIIEKVDWDGNIIWTYNVSDSLHCQHHDIELLPNGNILVIAWDLYDTPAQVAKGRTTIIEPLWSEKIIEIEPDYVNGGGTVVWEWKAWDHLVQDVSDTIEGYGVVSEHPELIDINYIGINNGSSDWLHFNSLDYHEGYDQIVISVHHSSEIWIIDHSTTTAEAASHSGGNSGKGGDLLYRWGNPIAYQQGTVDDQQLHKQHDAQWIQDSLVHGGMILIFDNQEFLPVEGSAVDVVETPVDAEGNYAYSGGAYLPESTYWTYQADPVTDFYSQRISGAQRLSNGNTLICQGRGGRFFEVDLDGNIVWEYINPVSANGIIAQGFQPAQNNVFRATRYPLDYLNVPADELNPIGPIETGSDYDCTLVSNEDMVSNPLTFKVSPNPFMDLVYVEVDSGDLDMDLVVVDMYGKVVYQEKIDRQSHTLTLDSSSWAAGVYGVSIRTTAGTQSTLIVK